MSGFRDSAFYVVGLGRTGRAAAEFLLAQGSEVFVWDDETATLHDLSAEARVLSPHIMYASGIYDRLGGILLSPGIDDEHMAADYATRSETPLISDISLFACAFPKARCIGITGTNGKSTVCRLTSHVLSACGHKAHAGGNIGEPVLAEEQVEAAKDNALFVLELSSYQMERLNMPRGFFEDLLDEFQFTCEVAVLLNIAEDHLDRHKTMEGYVAAKCKLFEHLHPKALCVIGIDDDYSRAVYEKLKTDRTKKTIAISGNSAPKGGIGVKDGALWDGTGGKGKAIFPLQKLPLLSGAHNVQNIAATYAILKHYNVATNKMAKAFASFKPLPHRQEAVGRKGKILFVNDSKATNSSAVGPALEAFENIYWLAGGIAKERDFSVLEEKLSAVKRGYFYGQDKFLLEEAFRGEIECDSFSDLESAFARALKDAMEEGGEAVILLSPVAASFDQFRDFQHRGEVFTELVKAACR